MLTKSQVEEIKNKGRSISKAESGDEDLGPFKLLPGLWRSLPGRGWNMIALPFAGSPLHYRLLVNQYNEELKFSLVDKGVPNRGIRLNGTVTDADQFLVTLDYEQRIRQIAADDFPQSGLAGDPGNDIHHEPGLFLHMTNETTNQVDIARLATVPHGDAVMALGKSEEEEGSPQIPNIDGLPIGVSQDLNNDYLSPYKHFHDNLFEGLFDPTDPNKLLNDANTGVNIVKTTKLEFNTDVESGGISNIPFIVKQANATEMKSTFWVQELAEEDAAANPKLRLQYSQIVFLEFFQSRDGSPGLIRWPHVSINTLEKIANP